MLNDNHPDKTDIDQRLDAAMRHLERTSFDVMSSAMKFRREVEKLERTLRFVRYMVILVSLAALGFVLVLVVASGHG